MNQIFIMVLLLGLASPAFGLPSSIGGGTVAPVNACGCNNWGGAEYIPAGMESTCSSCNSVASSICRVDEICDDHEAGNSYGVIVGSTKKLTVECGTWVPEQQDVSGAIRAGYWSVMPYATCEDITTYRCGAGRYGSPTSETGTCHTCPGFEPGGKVSAVSSEFPRTSITSCYIMPNKAMSDTTGTYIYTDGCFYKK